MGSRAHAACSSVSWRMNLNAHDCVGQRGRAVRDAVTLLLDECVSFSCVTELPMASARRSLTHERGQGTTIVIGNTTINSYPCFRDRSTWGDVIKVRCPSFLPIHLPARPPVLHEGEPSPIQSSATHATLYSARHGLWRLPWKRFLMTLSLFCSPSPSALIFRSCSATSSSSRTGLHLCAAGL